MSIAIKVADEFYQTAKAEAKAEKRTISGQVEYWARLGRAAKDNPDLPIEFVEELLISKAQNKVLAEPFQPE